MIPGIRISGDGKRFAIWCPGCRAIHGWIPLNRWAWNPATNTLSPSVRHFVHVGKPGEPGYHEDTFCHYNVTNGRITYHGDSHAHQLRGEHALDQEPPADYGGREYFGW